MQFIYNPADLPEYRASLRQRQVLSGAPRLPGPPPMMDLQTPAPGLTGRLANGLAAAAPGLGAAFSTSTDTPEGDRSQTASLLGALMSGMGGSYQGLSPSLAKIGTLGGTLSRMVAENQAQAGTGRALAQILQEYKDDPEGRRDAMIAYLASHPSTYGD